MRTITRFVCLLVLVQTSAYGQATDPDYPLVDWHAFSGGQINDTGLSVALGGDGAVYVGGYSKNTNVIAGSDATLSRFDENGTLHWKRSFGAPGPNGDDLQSVVYSNGAIFGVGYSGASWGSPLKAHAGGGNADFLLVRFDEDGNLLWHTFFGSPLRDRATDIALDVNGNLIVTGTSEGTWGSPVMGHPGSEAAFVAAFSPDGQLLWNTFFGHGRNKDMRANSVAVDADGIVVTGSSAAPWGTPIRAYFSNGSRPDAYVAKLSSEGELLWNTFLGGRGTDHGMGVAIDSRGKIFVTGNTVSFSWGQPVNPFANITSLFIARLQANGVKEWHTFHGSDFGTTSVVDIALDSRNNPVVVGWGGASWQFDNDRNLNWDNGLLDGFVASVSWSGKLLWNHFLGGERSDSLSGVAIDDRDRTFVAGIAGSYFGRAITEEHDYRAVGDQLILARLQTGDRPTVLVPGDIDGDGTHDITVITGDGRVKTKSIEGKFVSQFNTRDTPLVQQATIIDDFNGNGAPELAFWSPPQSATVFRDIRSGEVLHQEEVFAPLVFRDFEVLGDLGGDGIPELAYLTPFQILVEDTSNDRLFSAASLGRGLYEYMVAINDRTGDAAPELVAVDNREFRPFNPRIETWDIATGTRLAPDIWMQKRWRTLQLVALADINGNGAQELGVLRTNAAGSKMQLVIKDSGTGEALGFVGFDPNTPVRKIKVLPDSNGNGADEVVVFGQRRGSRYISAQVKDTASQKLLNVVHLDRNLDALDLAILPDQNGNGSGELVMLVRRASDGMPIVIIKDSITGELIRWMSYGLPNPVRIEIG